MPSVRQLASVSLFALTASAGGHTWHVDCNSGDVSARDASVFSSLRAVSSHVFQPGDAILFQRGSVCQGMLAPKGSGTEAAPIRLGDYGAGPLPRIVAEPGQPAAFQLKDQQYWTIENLEFVGGNPHGVHVTGTNGVLHGIHIRDIVVHGVTGEPKTKEGGLLVIAPGSEHQRFDDVVVDSVIAYATSQWAGILVGGVSYGFLPEEARSTNVTVRNSIVHDVAGDGIILFQVNHGTIENSVAWNTGLQKRQTIGTPNAIWTWMCRDCTVRRNEAFLTNSPDVDGGAFDIDYGSDNTLLEENYGHDTQGYCIGVFGYGWNTTNSVVRNNTCADNGRRPDLARQQGAIFLSTTNHGKLKGLDISGNRIFWNPPVTSAAIVSKAQFIGSGSFRDNEIYSASPRIYRVKTGLAMERNPVHPYEHGHAERPRNSAVWTLVVASTHPHIAIVESAHFQFPRLNIRFIESSAEPSIALLDPEGRESWRHAGLPTPAELGLALRERLGEPNYAELAPKK